MTIHPGVSVNTTGQNNIMEERSSGENTYTLSNSRDTSCASSMGPPVGAANATAVSTAPDGAPATAVTSQQQSLRRSSSGRQQLPPHDLVNNPITVERVSGTKHKVVAMKPNPGGRNGLQRTTIVSKAISPTDLPTLVGIIIRKVFLAKKFAPIIRSSMG